MCSFLSSSFAFFDGDFIRHLPRPLQHHIDEVPRARRLVSVDGNSLSKRRNIIRELGQRNPNTDDPTTTLSWLFRGSWWASGMRQDPFFLSQYWMESVPTSPPRPAGPIHLTTLGLLERDGLYNTPPLDSMQQMASHQPNHVLKRPPFSPSETGHLLHQRDATDASRGEQQQKSGCNPAEDDQSSQHASNSTAHPSCRQQPIREGYMEHGVCLQLKPSKQPGSKQATQQQKLNHHIHQGNVSLCSRSRFIVPLSARPIPEDQRPPISPCAPYGIPGWTVSWTVLVRGSSGFHGVVSSLDKRSTGPLSPREHLVLSGPTPASTRHYYQLAKPQTTEPSILCPDRNPA